MADIATLEINTDPLIATLEIGATLNVTEGTWGSITGTLSAQTDLQSALDAKAASTHTHSASDITSGTLALARLPQSYGGNGVADYGKVATFNSEGGLVAQTLHAEGAAGLFIGDANFDASGLTDARAFSLPDADGTLATQEWATAGFSLANHTGLPLTTGVTGTLPVANGGTGATSVYAARRAMFLGMHRVITSGSSWTAGSISGTTTQGTESTNFYGFLSINTATAGKNRLYHNVSSSGPLWPGAQGAPDFSRKCIVNLSMLTRLSAHADSRVSIHFTLTSVATHTSFDRSEEGISIILRGGASAGTVALQTHDGTTATTSATASIAINDQTGYPWTLEWEPGVAARLYRGSTLMCTATDNLPSGTTAGASQMGICVLAENTTSGTGNATTFRWLDCYITEIP